MALFTIREATSYDFPAIVPIMNTSTPQPYTLEGFTAAFQHLKTQLHFFQQWVLKDGGHIAGIMTMYDHHAVLADELFTLPVVAPKARNQGYGSALLSLSVETARA